MTKDAVPQPPLLGPGLDLFAVPQPVTPLTPAALFDHGSHSQDPRAFVGWAFHCLQLQFINLRSLVPFHAIGPPASDRSHPAVDPGCYRVAVPAEWKGSELDRQCQGLPLLCGRPVGRCWHPGRAPLGTPPVGPLGPEGKFPGVAGRCPQPTGRRVDVLRGLWRPWPAGTKTPGHRSQSARMPLTPPRAIPIRDSCGPSSCFSRRLV